MGGMLFISGCLNNAFTVMILFGIVPVRIPIGDCCALKPREQGVTVIHA